MSTVRFAVAAGFVSLSLALASGASFGAQKAAQKNARPAPKAASPAQPPPAASLTDLLDAASRKFERQDYAGARRDYERATKLDPGSISAWRGLGWCLWQLGERAQAYKVWNDIDKVQPNDPDTLLALAQAREIDQDYDTALKLYGRVLERDSHRRTALQGRARVYFATDNKKAAEGDLVAVLEQAPGDFDATFLLAQVYKATGREAQARTLFERLASRAPDSHNLASLADVFLELGRNTDAIRMYKLRLKADPGNRGVMLGLARTCARLQHYDAALQPMEAWLGTHHDDTAVREEAARYASGGGQFARAAEHLRVLTKDHPQEIRWRVALAQALLAAGKPDEASKLAQAALADEPKNIAALELMLSTATMRQDKPAALGWLVRLADADPTPKRLSRVGDLYMALGRQSDLDDRQSEAHDYYVNSVRAFEKSRDADPLDTDAVLGLATALRLSGDYRGAIKVATDVVERYPTVERARRELYEAYLARGDYDKAEQLARDSLAFSPGSVPARLELARTRFQKGDRDGAIVDVQALLQQPIRDSVPVLLYHGISEASVGESAMPLAYFRDQMQALKKAGYHAIGIPDLLAFLERGEALPANPVLITFDDARSDSFRYADPVLKATGFKATMFTPVAEVGKHGAFNATWDTMRAMYATGRWDLQCHSYVGHVSVPIDAGGRPGAYLANRMWLPDQNRLETNEEFNARIEDDYQRCASELAAGIPGLAIAGYAYPFGEVGQRVFSNEPEAVALNKTLAKRYFKAAFVQDPAAEVTRLSDPAVLARFEVPWHFSGKDLLDHLRDANTWSSTELVLADLYSWNGQYAEATAIFDQVAQTEKVNRAALLARRGRLGMWQGDYASARQYLVAAAELEPANRVAQQGLADLDRHARPRLALEGAGDSDNRERSFRSLGPVQEFHLGDTVTAQLAYRQRRYEHGAFDTTLADPASTAGVVDLRASGHEFEGGLSWSRNWRTEFSVAAGVAKFDDASSQPQGSGGESFPLASARIDLPLGADSDFSLSGSKGYVGTAGGILNHLGRNSLEARVKLQALENARLEVNGARANYGDGNRRTTASAALMGQFTREPVFEMGARARYDGTSARSPYYYAPDGYQALEGVMRLTIGRNPSSNLVLEASYGEGQERNGTVQPQAGISAIGRAEIGRRIALYFSGGYSRSADYNSTDLSAGISAGF